MQEIKLNLNVKESEEKIIYQGLHACAEVNQYYDLNGRKIDEGKKVIKVPNCYANFSITSKIQTYDFGGEPFSNEIWTLYVNGKKQEDLGEIVGFQALKTKLKLTSCIGTG